MTDSDIEIVGENYKPNTIIVLDSNDDSDDFLEADERQEVIELDHALAKSSNVPSPKEEEAEEEEDGDESFITAQSKSELDVKEASDESFNDDDSLSDDALVRLSSRPPTRSNSTLSALNKSPEKSPLKESTTRKDTEDQSSTDANLTPLDTRKEKQNAEDAETNIAENQEPGKDASETDVETDATEIEDQQNDELDGDKDKEETMDNTKTEVEKVDPILGNREPGKDSKETEVETDTTNIEYESKGNLKEKETVNNEPNGVVESKPDTSGTANLENDDKINPANTQDNKLADTNYNADSESAVKAKPKFEKSSVKEPKLHTDRAPSLSLEDDFFSMSYGPMIPTIPKVKKKKKLKRKKSEEQDHDERNRENTKSPSADLTPVTDTNSASTSTNVEGTPRKKKRLTRPVTPPSIDEEAFKRDFALAHGGVAQDPLLGRVDNDDDDSLLDDTYEFKKSLERLQKMRESFDQEKANDSESAEDSRSVSVEQVRSYVLHLTSHLPGSDNHALDITVKGTKKFHAVISKSLKYLLSLGIVPPRLERIYRPDEIVLYWNKMKILDFMRPDSLKLPVPVSGEPTVIELGLYTKTQGWEIETQIVRDREEKLRKLEQVEKLTEEAPDEVEAENEENPFEDDELFQGMSQPGDENILREATPNVDNDESEEGFFKIGLKGEDNKKIVVKVHAGTQLTSLVKHFLTKKGLPETTKVSLVFDDEELELDGTVGDTELEEDFSVDVIVKK